MRVLALFVVVLALAGCRTPQVNYERSRYGLPIACVDGACQELSQETQLKMIKDLLELYDCPVVQTQEPTPDTT